MKPNNNYDRLYAEASFPSNIFSSFRVEVAEVKIWTKMMCVSVGFAKTIVGLVDSKVDLNWLEKYINGQKIGG